MSTETEILTKFNRYLTEIEQKCGSCKENISDEESKSFLSYVEEAKKILQRLSNRELVMSSSDKAQLIVNCCQIILIFTKYILSDKDETSINRLKNTSPVKEGLLALKKDKKYPKELQHKLLLFKKTYFDRLDSEIKMLMHYDLNDKNYFSFEKSRLKFYQAQSAIECKAIFADLCKKHADSIEKDIPHLAKMVENYSSIVEQYTLVINYNKTAAADYMKDSLVSLPTLSIISNPVNVKSRRLLPPIPVKKKTLDPLILSKANFFEKKLGSISRSHVKDLIKKFNQAS